MKIVFPDYNNCLTNVTNSILKYFNITTYHQTLKELDEFLTKDYKNIVLLLYDGMGANLLERNNRQNSFLNHHKIKNITAVFPPTTTASTTSVLSGLNPCEHGWLGWDLYFKELDETVTMFLNTKKDTTKKVSSENIAQKYYPYTSIIERIKEENQAYQLMPFGPNAYLDLNDRNEKIINLCQKEGKKFIYAYSDEPDHTMHEYGTEAQVTRELFREINQSTKKLCKKLKDTLVIVIADHGHLNCESITLKDYPDFFSLLRQDISIEGRACAFFIKENKNKEFEELFHQYFKNDFLLLTKEEVLDKKIFGIGKKNQRLEEAIGDYLAIATGNKYFRYDENSVNLKSMHAGITEDEVLVPLIIYEAKGEGKNGI